jgi:hypothetical protein
MGETLPEARLQRSDLIEKSLREARALGMVDQTPQGGLVGLEADGQLIELVLETMGVERAGVGPPPEKRSQASDVAVMRLIDRVAIGRARQARESLLGDCHDCLSPFFRVASVGPILGSGAQPRHRRGCGTIKFPKLFDKTRIRLYQVSIQIHLKTSMKNLVKNRIKLTVSLRSLTRY